ncbi:MAG: hypothetical protein V4733_04380 [Verrucomicrobiota bacterium]
MKPDALIRVRFLTSTEGGRESGIFASRYGCPVFIDGYAEHGFDCRFLLDADTCFELGSTHDVKIKFMNPDLALPHMKKGTSISLWEGRTIATGQVVSVSSA